MTLTPRRWERRSLLIAVLLPCLVAVSQLFVLQLFTQTGQRANWQVTVTFVCFVLEVGIAGFVAARYVPGLLGWIVFGWTLLLIDILTFCMAVNQSGDWLSSGKMLASALVAGQVGASIIWAVLGDQRWNIRIPLFATIAISLLLLWRYVLINLSYYNDWFPMLMLQSALLFAECTVLFLRGFRLLPVEGQPSAEMTVGNKIAWQFNLKDAFIYMTAIAIVMAVFRLTAMAQTSMSRPFYLRAYLLEIVLAVLLATALFAAVWAAFGQRHWLPRLGISFGTVLAVGCFLGWGCDRLDDWIYSGWQTPQWSWGIQWLTMMKWWWLSWITLASGFLVATIWILRERGYRLVPIERRRSN